MMTYVCVCVCVCVYSVALEAVPSPSSLESSACLRGKGGGGLTTAVQLLQCARHRSQRLCHAFSLSSASSPRSLFPQLQQRAVHEHTHTAVFSPSTNATMMSLQRIQHCGHLAPGAMPTAAQRALQQERDSLPTSTSHGGGGGAAAAAAAAIASAGGEEDDGEVSFVSPSLLSPLSSQSSLSAPSSRQQPAAAAATKVRAARSSAADGMRREWKFALQFVHVAGQLLVPCSPQWEYEFIDVDRTAYGVAQRSLPASTDVTPMLAVLAYSDRTAVAQAVAAAAKAAAASPDAGNTPVTAALQSQSMLSNGVNGAAAQEKLLPYASLNATSNGRLGDAAAGAGGAGGDGEWWLERPKHVELFYCHSAPDMTLELLCKRCVKFILNDPHVVSVDGDSRLAHLRIGDKLRCPYKLGGRHRSFHLRYVLRDRSELQETYVYAIGAVVGQRGYFLRVECASLEELEGYLQTVLLPNYATPGRAHFGVDITYHNVPPTTILIDQQEAFGELQYVDHKAAIVFVIPVYPMKILPDYSPAKTVGVGSITCMTLELSVHERLLDDAVAAEMIGVAKYKVNPVVLCVEVEEVSRMGYPKVMSTEQYSALKAKRVADVFPDAKMVGLPTSLYMGNRIGRSRTMTFTYDPLRCVVKALVTSTLVGNFGVTAFYLTKLGGGLFDSHLYVFQQLLSGVEYLPQNNSAKNTRVSRYRVQNIHLGDEDLLHAYRCAHQGGQPGGGEMPSTALGDGVVTRSSLASMVGGDSTGDGTANGPASPTLPPHLAAFTTEDPTVVAATRERHLHYLTLSNDGRVEGGVVAAVPVEEGGVPTRRTAGVVNAPSSSADRKHGANKRGDGERQTSAAEEIAGNGATRPASASLFSTSRSVSTVASMVSCGFAASAAGVEDARRGAGLSMEEDEEEEETPAQGHTALATAAVETASAHSGSRISVEGISHLLSSASGSRDGSTSNEEDDEEEGRMDFLENDLGPSLTSQDAIGGPSFGGSIGQNASAATLAAVGGASNSTSLHRHNSQHSPLTAAGTRAEEGGLWTGNSTSRPGSAKRRKQSGQRGSVDAAFSPSASAMAAAAEMRGCPLRENMADTSLASAMNSAAGGAGGGGGDPNAASAAAEEGFRQQELYEQLVGKGDPLVQQTLRDGEGGTLYGPSLRDVYARCCEAQQCRPNSYLMEKLPAQPKLTYAVEELDLSSNYVGHNGFVAVLHLLEHLPRLRVVHFNNMSLDTTDAESLCYVLATNMTVREVHLENNTGISLPSMRHFTALLRMNPRIEVLALDGTRLSSTLVQSLKEAASKPRT